MELEEVAVTAGSLPCDLVAKILLKMPVLESFVHGSMVCKGWRHAAQPLLHNHGKKGIWYALCCVLDPTIRALHSVKSYWKLHSTLLAHRDEPNRWDDPFGEKSATHIRDIQFIMTFQRHSRFINKHAAPVSIPFTLDGARGQANKLAYLGDDGEFVDFDDGAITSWEVPHALIAALGWASAADAHRAADQWARMADINGRPSSVPVPDGPLDLEQMRQNLAEERNRKWEEIETLQDAEAPAFYVRVSVRAFHTPTQRICDLVDFQPVLPRDGSPLWGRVQFRDERLLCAPIPPARGDINTRLPLRSGWFPFVNISLDQPSDVNFDDETERGPDVNRASKMWRCSEEGRPWKLSLGIVARPQEHVEGDTMTSLQAHDRGLSEMTARVYLQNAHGWGK